MSRYLKFWRTFNVDKRYQAVISRKGKLHRNSVELVRILSEHDVLSDGCRVFEIGCGQGRNLKYFLDANPEIKVAGNDLIRQQCFRYMDADLKDKIDFHEIDTLSLARGELVKADLLLMSDHMMHLDPASAKEVLDVINEKWKPAWVMLREGLEERRRKPIKHIHNYDIFDSNYDKLYESVNDPVDGYLIRLYKRKAK
jgi:SAM-dependent methyltransferase